MKTTLRDAARELLRLLAYDCFQGANLWPRIDRIERRFHMQGYAEGVIAGWRRKRQESIERAFYAQGWVAGEYGD